jgi:hypothetical protein
MTHAAVAGISPRLLKDGILAGSEEGFNLQVYIDPLEEKFYVPTQLVKTAADQSWEDKLFVRHINTFPVSGSGEPTCQIFSGFLRAAPSVAIPTIWSQRKLGSDQEGSIECEKTACLHNRKRAHCHTRSSI